MIEDDLESVFDIFLLAGSGSPASQYLAISQPGSYGDRIDAELRREEPPLPIRPSNKTNLHGRLMLNLSQHFPAGERFDAADMTYAFGSTKNALLHAQLFCPEFIEVDGSILLANGVSQRGRSREESFLIGKQEGKLGLAELEASFNHVEVYCLFSETEEAEEDYALLADIMVQCWRARLGYLYPKRRFQVSLLPAAETSHGPKIEFFEIR